MKRQRAGEASPFEATPKLVCLPTSKHIIGTFSYEHYVISKQIELEKEQLNFPMKGKGNPMIKSKVVTSVVVPPKIHHDYQERYLICLNVVNYHYYIILFDLWKMSWIEESCLDVPSCGAFGFEMESIFLFEEKPYFILMYTLEENITPVSAVYAIDFTLKKISLKLPINTNLVATTDCDFLRVHKTLFDLKKVTRTDPNLVTDVTFSFIPTVYDEAPKPTENASVMYQFNAQENCGTVYSFGGYMGHISHTPYITRVSWRNSNHDAYFQDKEPSLEGLDIISASSNAVSLIGDRYMISVSGYQYNEPNHDVPIFDCFLNRWIGCIERNKNQQPFDDYCTLHRNNPKLHYLHGSHKLLLFGGTRSRRWFYSNKEKVLLNDLAVLVFNLPSNLRSPLKILTQMTDVTVQCLG